MNEVNIYPLAPDRWGDFEKLFGPGGAYAGCWCMWPRLRSKDWGASRSAGRKAAMRAIVQSDEPPGLLAYMDGEPVGWVSVDRRERLDHFEYSRKLKALDRPDALWSIVCFVIDKEHRQQGLMSRLLEGALAFTRERGAWSRPTRSSRRPSSRATRDSRESLRCSSGRGLCGWEGPRRDR